MLYNWDNKSEFAHFIRGAFDAYIFLLLTKKHAEINIQDQEQDSKLPERDQDSKPQDPDSDI